MMCDGSDLRWVDTAIGGSIAALAGVLGAYLSYRLDSIKSHRELLHEALATWSESFENCIAIHRNYHSLTQLYQPDHPDEDLKKRTKDEIVRVSIEAGKAGRALDTSHYRVLLLERRQWARTEVSRLTKLTEQSTLTGSPSDVAGEYMKRVPEMRQELLKFLEKLTNVK